MLTDKPTDGIELIYERLKRIQILHGMYIGRGLQLRKQVIVVKFGKTGVSKAKPI